MGYYFVVAILSQHNPPIFQSFTYYFQAENYLTYKGFYKLKNKEYIWHNDARQCTAEIIPKIK